MNTKYMLSVVSFGEVLWDLFPTHKKIGGAPLNVALRMNSLGAETAIISCVGADEGGKEIMSFINDNDISTDLIQIADEYKTGVVHVMINEKGNASYDISYPSAWDKIIVTKEMDEKVSEADVFVFGSLICRDEVSRATLYNLLDKAKYKVLDANLRAPYYTADVLNELMLKADFIKLNDEELYEISQQLESPYNSFEQNIKFIAEKTNTKHVCVTKGAFGAVLYYNDKFYYNSGYFIKVVDTVGAGDSFLASLIVGLLRGKSPQKSLNYACAVGVLVAGHEGANPKISEKEISKFMKL
ncbi:carbohydrate kinase family protein [Flavobacterium gawalongense]|uniref:Carbohydrate kinase n=1 Tax=Flavobacterium gawalongense TaxID=2594432 RepID=A0ABY3CH16_9FLAO|nr:carbohydrate kinase [Flavobacterium gawalongense]TRX03288.1 carbohydrate kinase [Flavobacterium gawalongense]TRX03896.1 carbohydrate kinase [Flavobacterium gawalongense]